MSWADVNLNEDPVDLLSKRFADLEDTISTQFDELRTQLGMALAAMPRQNAAAPDTFMAELEEKLAQAVTVSLSAALEAIRHSLTEVVANAMRDLGGRMDERLAEGNYIEVVAATLQHAVLLALSSFEQSAITASRNPDDPLDTPATTRDIARVNARIDELRALLLG